MFAYRIIGSEELIDMQKKHKFFFFRVDPLQNGSRVVSPENVRLPLKQNNDNKKKKGGGGGGVLWGRGGNNQVNILKFRTLYSVLLWPKVCFYAIVY